MATNAPSTKVVTDPVRLAFVNLFEPRAGQEGQAPRYSVCLMIPKDDAKNIRKIKAAQKAAAEAGKAKFGGKIPPNLKTTLRDADDEMDMEKYPEFEGHLFMNIGSSEAYPPSIVDTRVNPIIDRGEVYSGMWARVSMNAFAFNTQGNKGISFGMNHVQKVRDDEPFGNVSRASDDFDVMDDEDEDDGGLI